MRGVKPRKQVKVKSGSGGKSVTKKTKSGTVNIGTGSKGKKLKKEVQAGKKKVRQMRNTQKTKARKSKVSTRGKVKPTYFSG